MEFIKNKKVLLSAISLFIFSFIVYFPSLSNDFVWDDVALIERSVSKFESGSISKLFIPDIKKNKNTTYYRPAIVLSYISDNYFWGKNPFGFHLTNNFIFSINVLLVFVLSFILLKGLKISSYYLIAVISALFFALHPVHVESVSWISGRTDLLCGMFFSLASIFHLSIMNRSYFIPISVLCFMLALFSKETALAFPFVVFFIDIVRRSLNKEQLLTYIFYLFLILIYFNIRSFPIELTNITKSFSSALGISAYFFQDIEIINELLKLLSANLYYITTLIAPFNLNAFIAELPGGNFYVLGAVLYFLLLIFIFFYSLAKAIKILSISIFWIIVTLGPSLLILYLGIVPTPVAERYLYIPSIGYCLLLSFFLFKLYNLDRLKILSVTIFLFFMISFTYLNIERQGVWKNRLSLWKDTSIKSFNQSFPHVNYGLALENTGKIEKAKEQYLLALNPNFKDTSYGRAATCNKLAILYFNEGEDSIAIKWLNKAIEFNPDYNRTYYHFGLYYYIRANKNKIIMDYYNSYAFLITALTRSNGSYPKANLLISKIFLELNKKKLAKKYARKAIKQGIKDELIEEAKYIIKVSN